jgi:hypothetical protein
MSKRWLTGVLLFALCLGSAFLGRLTSVAAAVPPKAGTVEDGLSFVDGADFTLKYATGANSYVVVVSQKAGVTGNNEQISLKVGAISIAKKDLQSATIYRLTPVGIWQGGFRPCHGWDDCPVPRPLPPPPPPIRISDQYLDPTTRVPAAGAHKPVR